MISNDAPYLLGQMSYYSQVPRIGNPYPTGSDEWKEWNRGWDQAKEESEGKEDSE